MNDEQADRRLNVDHAYHIGSFKPYTGTGGLIVGLAGKAGSGKSTAATILERELGFTRTAFAYRLKRIVGELYGFTYDQIYGSLKDVIDERYGFSPRYILQRFGQGARDADPYVWVRALYNDMQRAGLDNNFVIDDVRYDNEAESIHSWGGFVFEIESHRAYQGDLTQHSSEMGVSSSLVNANIFNHGDIEDLEGSMSAVYAYVRSIKERS